MEQVNSAGHLGNGLYSTTASPEAKADEPFRWEYAYDPQGRIANEVALNRQGQRISTTIYGPANSASIRNRTAYVIKRNGSLAPERGSCAAFVSYDYSSEGYVTQTHYHDQEGTPTPGKDGAFTKQQKYDGLGRVIESTSLWKDGRPMNDMDGGATERSSYDEKGNLVSIENIDAAGNPAESNKSHIHLTAAKYDERGSLVEISLQHPMENPISLINYANQSGPTLMSAEMR
jgi:hypothetical protein